MRDWSKKMLPSLLAIFLGISLTLAFAPYRVFPLAIIAPAGLLLLWLKIGPKQAFWIGYLFGLGFFGTGVSWVYISIYQFGGVPFFLSILITMGFIALLALFFAYQGYILNRYFLHNNKTKILCAFPAIWLFSEWARTWLFSGFPWLLIGYSQTLSPLKGYAPILSVYGVSLATVLSSAFIVHIYLEYKKGKFLIKDGLGLLSIWILGALLTYIPWTKPEGKPITVSLVQGNIPQELKWSPDHLQLSLDRYEELTKPLLGKSQLVIWPEGAIPLPLNEATDYIDALDTQAKKTNTNILLGIPIQATKEEYYNSIVTVGEKNQVYLKRQLVPFGEFMPYPLLFSKLFHLLNIPMSSLIAGKQIQAPFILNGIKILPSICYEIAYPELINTNDKTIGAILSITNDAWFGESAAQAQHVQMAEMRAIELQRPVLFVSNNGLTAIINAYGKIQSAAPTHQTYVLQGLLQPHTGLTPWMRNGIDPLLFILLCLIFIAVIKKNRPGEE